MTKKIKITLISISIALFLATAISMIVLSLLPKENNDIYNHVSYSSWLKDEIAHHQSYISFKLDETSGSILAHSTDKGQYIIDASPTVISQLSQIDTQGEVSSSLLKGLHGANSILEVTFGQILDDPKSIGLWVWLSLGFGSLSSFAAIMIIYRVRIKKVNI